MCGIIGSLDKNAFDYLFHENKERGNFAYGAVKVNMARKPSIVKSTDFTKEVKFSSDAIMYLGHLQSPTSAKREFDKDTTHPFKYMNLYIAHNGVLENFEELKQINPDLPVNEVDSSIIAPLIVKYGISDALSMLKGTFGCWMFDNDTNELFVFRSGSTIYTDGANFSSKQIKGWTLFEEGIVYRFNYTKVIYERYDKFQTSSGFFI